ncbi:PhnB protein [Minicystis rosea]|nr:PhnB protein [Minicystis rosea]
MRFLCLYRPVPSNGPPTAEHMAAMGKLIEEMKRAGTLLDTGASRADTLRARVRRSGAEVSVERGPADEPRHPIIGYAFLSAASMDEAIALAKRFLSVAGDGESEVLPLMDMPG